METILILFLVSIILLQPVYTFNFVESKEFGEIKRKTYLFVFHKKIIMVTDRKKTVLKIVGKSNSHFNMVTFICKNKYEENVLITLYKSQNKVIVTEGKTTLFLS